jgi:hypothetical protein
MGRQLGGHHPSRRMSDHVDRPQIESSQHIVVVKDQVVDVVDIVNLGQIRIAGRERHHDIEMFGERLGEMIVVIRWQHRVEKEEWGAGPAPPQTGVLATGQRHRLAGHSGHLTAPSAAGG